MYRVNSDNLIKVSQIQNGKVRKKYDNSFSQKMSSVIKEKDQGLTYEQKCSAGLLSTAEYVQWMYERAKSTKKL